MESTTAIREIPIQRREQIYGNMKRNGLMAEYYLRLLADGIVKKRLPLAEIHTIRERMKRLQNCNTFWSVETYKNSHIKVLLRTFLCKDKFCSNCNQVKKLILQNRYLPYMEKHKASLYHIVLTVPNCEGEKLRGTIQRMTSCFKTLVTYLNGNKKVKGLDLIQYGFQGCIRSLEITYNGDVYHPHFHVAAVLSNSHLEDKHISNQFSGLNSRLFSDFEFILQRLWWLLINGKRLTYDNICGNSKSLGRYSCTVNKFHANDYPKLFGYMTKMYSNHNRFMTYRNFKTLYYALIRVRQIQGYGVFYNVKELDTESYTEQDFQTLESYLVCEEQPTSSYEPLCRIVRDETYTVLRTQHKK